MRKIYVNFERPRTMREFLEKLFSCGRRGGYITSVETYKDKDCIEIQCRENKYRSFDDILVCVKTYYPSVKVVDVFKTLLNLKVGKNYMLYMFSCRDIKRINVFYSEYSNSFNEAYRRTKYDSKYSWKQLLDKAGIDTQVKLDEARKNKK